MKPNLNETADEKEFVIKIFNDPSIKIKLKDKNAIRQKKLFSLRDLMEP